MLRRLGHGCWSNASTTALGLLLRCRRSTSTLVGARRSVGHLVVAGSGDMDPPAASASPAATTNARWAMLNCDVLPRDEYIVADAKTAADCRTSAFGGGQLRVSLSVAPPPPAAESSFLYYDWTGSAEIGPREREFRVVAAHGDSVLFGVPNTGDCFVYRTGAGAATTRPPSLSQIRRRDPNSLWHEMTGLLRRSEDELLVAQLEVTWRCTSDCGETFPAEVWVLHDHVGGMREWELKPAIILDDDDDDEGVYGDVKRDRLRRWSFYMYGVGERGGKKVVSVGDRFLCWVDVSRGFLLLCDMAAEEPERCRLRLRYVPLPMQVPAQLTDSYSDDDEL